VVKPETSDACSEKSDILPAGKLAFRNMDVTEFRKFAMAAVNFVADYIENIRDR
jgi:hypothetical protein